MRAIIESQYFPCIEYFSFLKSQKEICIETKEHFIKQTYRNRCRILGANKVLSLSIPISSGNKNIPMDEVRLDYTHRWLNEHWRSIISAYNKSPFFEYYEPHVHDILFRKHERLLDLNMEILTFCLKALHIDTTIRFTEIYQMSDEDNLLDMRSVIQPKNKDFYRNSFHPKPYIQIFGQKFVANLSILDLLSCVGPDSDSYL